MALKDWKKFPNVKAIGQKGNSINLAWINKKTGEILYLNEFLIGSSFPFKEKFTGKTMWHLKSTRGYDYNSEIGRTRLQALEFAKSYMRSH